MTVEASRCSVATLASEANYLIGAVVRSGRRIVGVELNEVAPGPETEEWNADVWARVLYKLIGWCVKSQGAGSAGRG